MTAQYGPYKNDIAPGYSYKVGIVISTTQNSDLTVDVASNGITIQSQHASLNNRGTYCVQFHHLTLNPCDNVEFRVFKNSGHTFGILSTTLSKDDGNTACD